MIIDWRPIYLTVLAFGLALLAAASLAWIGGELHYRNCLQSVELRYPAGYQSGKGNSYGERFGIGPHAHFVFYEKAQRDRAISSCSRWP